MLKKSIKFAVKLKIKLLIAAVAVLVILGLALEAPVLHNKYIRSEVGSQVIMLSNRAGNGGGTGFAVKAPSGEVYTLSNAHVCRIEGGLYTQLENGRRIKMKILEVSDSSDLCLLNGLKGFDGLDLASSVSIGEELGLVGHPKLMPLTVSRGQLIGYASALVLVGLGPCGEDMAPPTYSEQRTPFGVACIMDVNAGFTNVVALPGNSGSPVVNIFGNVVGVLFASDTDVYWGIMVPLKEVKSFLKPY